MRLCLSFCLLPISLAFSALELSNDAFKIVSDDKGSLTITNTKGGEANFGSQFVVINASKDPKVNMRYLDIPNVRYHAPSWQTDKKTSTLAKANTQVEGGDGFVAEVQTGDTTGRTVDVFQAADTTSVSATGVNLQGRRFEWQYPEQKGFQFSAYVELPEGSAEPKVVFSITPSAAGWYSVGYTGAPATDLAALDEAWQPLIWQEKRFPAESVLTPAGYCTLPATFSVRGGVVAGVVADPAEMPFMPLPRWDNSLFAVALRNASGQAQPMVFAPILGGLNSKMEAGKPFTFASRLYVAKGNATDAYETVARSLYGFHDYRKNVGVSLNKTIENIVDYGMSEYSRFDDDLKGCMYETDVPGAVKNVSSLHPMELAVVTDNEEIFRKRALPILEYLLSREKFLFVLDKNVKTQSPGRLMTGPCAEASEFAAAFAYGGEQSPVLLGYARDLAEKKLKTKRADRWVQLLALYHSTKDPEMLKQAVEGADAYIAERMQQPEETFNSAEAGDFFFWTSYAPLWINLLDLYEVTGERRFLEASRRGAREFTQYVMMSPRIPEGDITINPGGKAPLYAYLKSKGHIQMDAPEESVPAWRLSEIGLTPESSPTVLSHRGIFMTNHAAWMMRLSEFTGDQFLRDVARSGVVGRYENFPGYHINTNRTTVYEKEKYPYHPHRELSYNSFHYNHVWPHATLLVDYLINDVFAKSEGKVTFPGRYSQGYGYLQSRIYGDRPGTYYDEKGINLWLPKGLLTIDNPQLNYVAGRRDGALFIALANQSPDEVAADVKLNPALAAFTEKSAVVKAWVNNQPASTLPKLENGTVKVTVPPAGLTVLMIDSLDLKVGFQKDFARASQVNAATQPLTINVGDARALMLNFGPSLRNAYIYLRDTDDFLESATLRYRKGEEWQEVTDGKYPFEFSVPLDPAAESLVFTLETRRKDGPVNKSEEIVMPLR